MKTLGICAPHTTVEQLYYEKRSLYKQAQAHYDRVVLIDTRAVTYQFIRGESQPCIWHNRDDISHLDSLFVHGTKGRESSTAILVRALKLCGCDIFDPIRRFPVGYVSKLLSTIERFGKGVGSSTFIAFDRDNTIYLLEHIQKNDAFPLIAKPIAGKKGRGIHEIPDAKAARAYVDEFFRSRPSLETPIYLQSFEEFVAEYRVLVVDGEALGMVHKVKQEGLIAANAAQGALFVPADEPSIKDFVSRHVSSQGLLGVDVAIAPDGEPHLIEANRAPQWQAFEQVTGIDVAQAIIKRSIERLEQDLTPSGKSASPAAPTPPESRSRLTSRRRSTQSPATDPATT